MAHSAKIDIALYLHGSKIRILQTSGDSIKAASELSPGTGILETLVDGQTFRRSVRVASRKGMSQWYSISLP